jgi:hypothetical protein
MKVRGKTGWLVAIALVGLVRTTLGTAATASNTGLASRTGEGSASVSGYAVSAVHFQLDAVNPQNVSSVTFTLDSAPAPGSTVKIHLPSSGATWFSCSMAGSPAVNASCPTTGVTVSGTDQLGIVVAD